MDMTDGELTLALSSARAAASRALRPLLRGCSVIDATSCQRAKRPKARYQEKPIACRIRYRTTVIYDLIANQNDAQADA